MKWLLRRVTEDNLAYVKSWPESLTDIRMSVGDILLQLLKEDVLDFYYTTKPNASSSNNSRELVQ